MVVSGRGVFDGAWGWAGPTFGGLVPGSVCPFGLSSIFISFSFIMFILGTVLFVGNSAHQTSDFSSFTDP